ncbi:MAG: putative metalloprotease CJM1_0395 family protein [Calditrichaeota bacterium]|nr:putative metalloprotease CJM1_0395 family protein [Calditrichota bacterium]
MQVSASATSPSVNLYAASAAEKSKPQTDDDLTAEEQKKVKELKKRDAEVRRHEQAHKAAAGQYAKGGPKFEFETGPDGRQYAVGGEVSIDTSEVANDPEATIRKAEAIKRAALAPKDPSSQDRRVAAEASRMEAKARQELAEGKREEVRFYNEEGGQEKNPAVSNVVNVFA